MYNPQRDLLVLVRHEFKSEKAIERELVYLNSILQHTELPHSFCIAHELVYRNRITSKFKKILKAAAQNNLKSFHFLINKN
jgi:hypothetical protein